MRTLIEQQTEVLVENAGRKTLNLRDYYKFDTVMISKDIQQWDCWNVGRNNREILALEIRPRTHANTFVALRNVIFRSSMEAV